MATQINSTKANFQIANCRLPTYVKNLTIGYPNQTGKWDFQPETGTKTEAEVAATLDLSATETSALPFGGLADGEGHLFWSGYGTSIDKMELAFPQVTLWEGVVTDNNLIPGGSNIDASDWEIVIWTDWEDIGNYPVEVEPDYNISFNCWIRNVSGGTKTSVTCKINWRSLI